MEGRDDEAREVYAHCHCISVTGRPVVVSSVAMGVLLPAALAVAAAASLRVSSTRMRPSAQENGVGVT